MVKNHFNTYLDQILNSDQKVERGDFPICSTSPKLLQITVDEATSMVIFGQLL